MMGAMEIRHSNGAQAASLAATLVSAFAASICCVGPLAAAFLGLADAINAKLPYRAKVVISGGPAKP